MNEFANGVPIFIALHLPVTARSLSRRNRDDHFRKNPGATRTTRRRCSLANSPRREVHNHKKTLPACKRNIEMTPLCKVEVTLSRVLGSREVRRGGGVDERAGIQPS